MSRANTPGELYNKNGFAFGLDPTYWQMKANKGGETYLKYYAFARPNTAIDDAGWMVFEILQDASGNVVSKKVAVTGTNQIGKFDQIYDASTAISISTISQANPGQVTTSTDHGLSTGDKIEIVGVNGMTEVNSDTDADSRGSGSVVFTITKVDATKFTIGVDTTAYGAYTSGGSVYNKDIFGLTYA